MEVPFLFVEPRDLSRNILLFFTGLLYTGCSFTLHSPISIGCGNFCSGNQLANHVPQLIFPCLALLRLWLLTLSGPLLPIELIGIRVVEMASCFSTHSVHRQSCPQSRLFVQLKFLVNRAW